MKRTIYVSIVLMAFFSVRCEDALSWDDGVTHKDLSEYASYFSLLRKCNNETDLNCDYLKKLGFNKGLDKDELRWNENTTIKRGYIKDWLREGAMLEDSSSFLFPLLGTTRSFNHFHNPLKPWAQAGLDDFWTGESSLLWAQDVAKQSSFILPISWAVKIGYGK